MKRILIALLATTLCGCKLLQVGSTTKPAAVVEAPTSKPYAEVQAKINGRVTGRIGTVDSRDHSGAVVNTNGDVTLKNGSSCWPVTIVSVAGFYLIGLHQKQPRYFRALKRRTIQ